MKIINTVILSIMITLIACKLEVENGTLPVEYVAAAKKYAGSFSGEMSERPGYIVLEVADNGKVNLNSSIDLIGQNCNSRIGSLKNVNFDKKSKRLRSASFSLNSGSCDIEGSIVTLRFKKDGKIKASILIKTTTLYDEECHYSPLHGLICTPTIKSNSTYLSGSFQ